jgi:hypothetical protein
MIKRIPLILAWFVFLLSLAQPAGAEMTSGSYRIRGSVQSGGGAAAGSANYQLKGTLAQPSPLMDSFEPPLSDNYDLYPGFWFVIAALESTCPGDFDSDKDVDGADLAAYILDDGGLGVDILASNFGKENCP